MKLISKALKVSTAALIIAASLGCAKTKSPGSPLTGTNGGAGPNNMDGTYAGGGGNGINGKAIESYHQDISALPEFQMYIAPILQRMAQSSPDVFVGYLNWAIHHKTWYLVPVALPNLPKDKTALAFPSDQLALHSESEIYIDQTAYEKKPRKERAYLLMHELVMGARLLMKHSAKFQCAALNSDQQSNSCDSEALLKLAKNPPGSEDEKPSLTGSDDEAVRSMTAYLMTHNQNYSGSAVRGYRLGLGFNYPWDRVVSSFTLDSLNDAFTRADASGDKLHVVRAPKADEKNQGSSSECTFSHSRYSNSFFGYMNIPWQPDTNQSAGYNYILMNTDDRFARADGVLDPRGGTQVVDHMHISPDTTKSQGTNGTNGSNYSIDFYVTREAHPRLIRVEAQEVAIISNSDKSNGEVIPIRGEAPIVCVVGE